MVACGSSSSDEPEMPEQEYTGPWEVVYTESYNGIHNDSPEFKKWFEGHSKWFDSAKFENAVTSWSFTASDDTVIWADYDDWTKGDICWVETINGVNEEGIKKIVKDFESFSIPLTKELFFDKFKASYKKQNNEL